MKKPKVSVLMGSYNHVNYVEAAIESVLNQTYRDFEFIVADDCSTDGTVEKLLQYEDKIDEIHLFDYNNCGRGRFLGERVKGEYVAIINSDDVWELDKLEKQIKVLEENPDAAGCFTWVEMIGEEGEVIPAKNPFNVHGRTKEEWMNYFYFGSNCMCHSSLLMRADVYYKYRNMFGEMFRQLPDFYLWVQIVQKYEIIVLEEKLTRMRRVDNGKRENVSSNSGENTVRLMNEESYIWYKTISNMENQYFLKAFEKQLINTSASSDIEVLCEKFFILLRPKLECFKIAAFYFFYDNNLLMQEELEKTYGFTCKDFYKLAATVGPGSYMQ